MGFFLPPPLPLPHSLTPQISKYIFFKQLKIKAENGGTCLAQLVEYVTFDVRVVQLHVGCRNYFKKIKALKAERNGRKEIIDKKYTTVDKAILVLTRNSMLKVTFWGRLGGSVD